MGIVVRFKAADDGNNNGKSIDDRIMFYLKGADMVMQDKVKSVYRSFVVDECDTLVYIFFI